MGSKGFRIAGLASVVIAAGTLAAAAAETPGVSATEIKIGQTMPYSGPASAYGVIGRAQLAYLKMINEQGGVNGHKINLISLDDGYAPPKTVEQTRKLIEQENVLADFNPLGTPTNTAIHKYLNDKKVPQLFVATGATKWGDPEHFPWTIGWQPNYQTEGHIYAKYILEKLPDAKIGVLYQNDDYGKDYVKGLKDGLGAKADKMIIAEQTYEPSDPTVDSQVVSLQSTGATAFYNVATPKFAAQAIRKSYDVGWKPAQFLNSVSASISAVIEPAGPDKAVGIITAIYAKDPTDPQWKNDKGYQDWLAWMKKYLPDGDTADAFNVYGYNVAMTVVRLLKQCGNDLSRENIMKQAASLNMDLPMLLPGVKVSTGPKQFFPIREMQLSKFNGKIFERFGDVIKSE
jgi:branched-chain amino acid transport system substrate-binding protein